MKIKASTQEHLDIEDIRDDMVVLKNGNAVVILETTAVNFDLLSEREQDAMIEAYGSLLNSLSFPIQIIIRSKRLDIRSYLKTLEEAPKGRQLNRYLKFIKTLTQENEVLDKKFYVAIPYGEVKISLENPLKKVFPFKQGKQEQEPSFLPEDVVERALPKLEPRIDHLDKQFARIGVRTKRLTTGGLIKLFYEIYNS